MRDGRSPETRKQIDTILKGLEREKAADRPGPRG
jgi:hypothetical protein